MKILTIAGVLVAVCIVYTPAFAIKFLAYGDTRDNVTENQIQSALFETENPAFILHVGDVWGATSQDSWKATFTGKTNLNSLLTANKVCVSRGNHETWAVLSAFSPSLVKGGSTECYSFTEGNCFVVCMGYDPAQNYAWLRQQLNSAASSAAKWRFIFTHKPIYSSYSGHGADGITSEGSLITLFRNYCDTFKVAMVFYGHDHGYERTALIYKGVSVDTGSTFNLGVTPGTVYVLTGAGGAPFHTASSQWWVGFQMENTCEFTVIDAGDDTCYAYTKNNSGTAIDQWRLVHQPATRLFSKTGKKPRTAATGVLSLKNGSFLISGPAGSPYSVLGLSGRVVLSGRLSAPAEAIHPPGVRGGVYIVEINDCHRRIYFK
jgi:hypothetical protein